MEILEGYAAYSYTGKNGIKYWKGFIKGNIFCKNSRLKPEKAIHDAKKLFNIYW